MAIKSFGQAKMEDIRLIEKKYDVKLPDDYINFLLDYNGGDVELDDDNNVYVRYLKNYIHVDILLGINTGNTDLDIEKWTDDYKHDMREGMIIIGHSYEHGFIVLNCYPNNQCISYWDDTYEFECSDDESNNYFMTDTFNELVKGII
ncbi:MAG: hypothetical protein BGN88_07690 [Clostridiales bacterium 43-6]|nr:MAG: hypothetical protein BGN88_07690 [Clostridiales bacterium 43-6]